MKKIYFMNNGEFDVDTMLTFGVSAKANDNAIGFFGTGFKYAVAIILRLGGSIIVRSLGKEHTFTQRSETIREKKFNFVQVNGRNAGFTTHLGCNWEPWMAFRELYCNAIDEAGVIGQHPQDYDTIIEVSCTEIADAYMKSSDYFLNPKLIHKSASVEIHEGARPYHYYRGVAIMPVNNNMFSYNITSHVDLTEDRTAKYNFQVRDPITEGVQSLKDKSILRKILSTPKTFEHDLHYSKEHPVSAAFLSVCRELKHTDKGIPVSARNLLNKLRDENGDWPTFQLTKVQKIMLTRAKKFLKQISIEIDDYPLKTVVGLGDSVMGRALDGTIYLSDMPFRLGTKQVASTLLEEWVHIKTGCNDFDRIMQNWLFDKILSLAEELQGMPL